MKRRRKQVTRNMRKNSRKRNKQERSLSYDALERRQLLAVGVGFEAVGADFTDENITSERPNPEGDVGPNHFVEIGDQTFTAYNRNGNVDLSISLNQFFVNAGAELFGEELEAPRIIYDRATERWFAAATGDGTGPLAGNWLHVAFSDNSDPTGQWQQVQFVPDITGLRLNTDVSLGVDADGVFLSTRNLINGDLDSVSIFSIPKADLFLANPTLADISTFDNLDPTVYGERVQFASNFEQQNDNTMFAFSNKDATTLNSFEINNAATATATLTLPVDVNVDAGNFPHPTRFDPIFAPPIMTAPRPIDQPVFADTGLTSERLAQPEGLTAGLIESNGSVFGARTVGLGGGFFEYLVNGINWFELNVTPGEVPSLNGSPGRGLNSHILIDHVPSGATGGDDNGNLIPEAGSVTYFNPSIAINDSGLVTVVFNGTTTFDAVNLGGVVEADFGNIDPVTGLPVNPAAVRNSVYASVGLRVNGARTGTDMQGNPIYGRQSIQLETPQLVTNSLGIPAYDPPGLNLWGQYSSVRPDPTNPNTFFAVAPFAGVNVDEWAVQVVEIQPIQLQPVIEATPDDDVIVIRLSAEDTQFVEIEINGEVTDTFPTSILDRIVVATFDGADRIVVDHVNGDPTPINGFGFFGGTGTDTIETNTTDNVEYEIDSLNATVDGFRYPLHIALQISAELGGAANANEYFNEYFFFNDGLEADGTLTHLQVGGVDVDEDSRVSSQLLDIETVVSGSGDDIFLFRVGPLGGDGEGRDGDDRFVFIGDGSVDGSINGGTGFNTFDVRQRNDSTEIELFSVGLNMGFNGRTVDGPVGQFNQIVDQFRDISWVRGSGVEFSNEVDSIQALNQFVATYTIVTPEIDPGEFANPADATTFVTTTLEQAGVTLYLTDLDVFAGSVLDDVFNVQSNSLDQITLIGRTGDDEFNFSSNAPTNTGVVGDILGLVFVEGNAGANTINVSDQSRAFDAEFLVLGARISGPLEVVYTASDSGTFDVNITGSNAANDTFILQSFLPTNTLNVFGLAGDDVFIIQDLSQAEVTLFGGEGDDEYIIEQVNGVDDRNVLISDSIDAERDVAIIAGTLLDEVFIVDLDSFESDQFAFIGVEEFGFDGRGGDDEFYVRAISEFFPIQLRGGDGNDVFHIASDAPTNLGDLTTINNDLSIDGGTGINRILISNESGDALDVEVLASQITGLFNGVLSYASTGGVFGLVDEDGNLDQENFGGIDITASNGGDDKFRITSFLNQNSLVIDGRLGEDEFIVGNEGSPGSIGGVIILDGASDGDTYTVFLENLSNETVMIDDSGFSGDDTLRAKGSSLDDNISFTQAGVTGANGTLGVDDFFEAVVVEGLGGNDTITMTNSPAESVILSGNDGDDRIIVNGTVGATEVTIYTTDGEDLIEINESSQLTTIMAFGGADVDTFVVGANVRGDVILDGQLGQDVYTIELTDNTTRNVQIVDMLGTSDVIVLGTAQDDVFTIDNNGVTSAGQTIGLNALASLGVQGRDGSDTFNIIENTVDLILDGGNGADVFNISSDAPFMTGSTAGIQGNIEIDGGTGNNQLRVTNVDGPASGVFVGTSMITGMTNNFAITYLSTGGQFARPDGTVGGIHLVTSDAGADFIDIAGLSTGDTLRVETRGGDDFIQVANSVGGDVLLDGGEGADSYRYQFGGFSERVINIVDTGMTGTDELILVGSDFDDDITLTPTGISDGDSTLVFNLPIDSILISGLGGQDTFTINGAPTENVRLEGNDGNDTFIVNNTAGITNIDLFAGLGNDLFEFVGSSDPTRIDAFGSGGTDTFNVGNGAFGRLFLDGEIGGDRYLVTYAGAGARRIDTRDSGTSGFDETQVFGTDADDRIAMRTARFLYDDEVVIFDENTERVQAHGLLGNDRLVIFGSRSPQAEIFAGSGDDNFVMNSGSAATQIDLHGQAGNDNYLIRKTTADTVTNLFGEDGNDRFNIGSTANQDSGNLGLIRGELNVFGGGNIPGGEDVLYANDRGVSAAYSYMVTPSSITPIAGPANLPRANFAGINFNSSIEAVRLDGTNQANLFQVIASQTARYFIDGNNPTNANADRLELMVSQNDGQQMFFTGDGEGFVTFTNGNEIVQFEDIEDFKFLDGGASSFVAPGGVLGGLDEFFSTSDPEEWEL